MIPVILASQSPRRRELFSLILQKFFVEASQAEEHLTLPPDLSPEEEPEVLAKAKATDIASRHPTTLVVGADTIVLCPDDNGSLLVLGKPKDTEDAKTMLRLLSGKRHYVVTGCCLVYNDAFSTFRVKTAVDFFPLTEEEIERYAATGEPLDKAGAYGIQGSGSLLIQGIEGDYFTVVGLPVSRLNREMHAFLDSLHLSFPGESL